MDDIFYVVLNTLKPWKRLLCLITFSVSKNCPKHSQRTFKNTDLPQDGTLFEMYF